MPPTIGSIKQSNTHSQRRTEIILIYRYVFGISMSPSDKAGEDKKNRAGAPEFLRKPRTTKPN